METLKNLELLQIPEPVKKDLNEFLNQIVNLYSDDLVSILVFGSGATGDYIENTSDINLLIVYSDLNITDLNSVASIANKWLKKRAFSPRFISLNNFTNSAKFFQIDMLEMKDMHVVLYGKDLLNEISIDKKNLHWQLSSEIKAMRMRIKQQFWRSCGDELLMRRILVERFTSLIHLSRVLLYLMNKPVSSNFDNILETSIGEFNISKAFIDKMKAIKTKKAKTSKDELINLFTQLMDVIRAIDTKSDQIIL